MKLCQNCGQVLAEVVSTCPSCGKEVAEGRKTIDDYRILEILHEGYTSILCRAKHESTSETVMIRIFTARSGIDEKLAARLKHELEELRKLPQDYFVRHFEIRRSTDGLWYRVSEWIEAESWSDLMAEGFFQDYRAALRLFARIASIIEGLHRIGHIIPHLILHDIIPFRKPGEDLQIKLDYKLSRFLDPKMDRPGPMLEKLLERHPDIVNDRPLDARSDIWSLGKIFVELLTADLDGTDYAVMVEGLALPREAETLLKLMLADDPDLRPRSMAYVAQTLAHIEGKDVAEAMEGSGRTFPSREIHGLKHWIRFLTIMIILLSAVALFIWLYSEMKHKDGEAALSHYANRYSPSVAFVVVEYRLVNNGAPYYIRRVEGTAFLVDGDGHLLTNRHVACPWLEDATLFNLIANLRQREMPVQFQYRAYVWFEGQQAFKRLPKMAAIEDLEDLYFLDRAFSSTGDRRLTILGVGNVPGTSRQQIRSPLGDDFAVLRIQPVPRNLVPLPLDYRMDPVKIRKLMPVLALGFPLGSQTQETNVNVSVTTGHVRRAFDNFLQVDTSLYRGNSGGPIINVNGKVIGIASSVAVDWTVSPIPVATPLSDMGMVLPIGAAVSFLQEIKAGKTKWNGILDLEVDRRIEEVKLLAVQKKWTEAQALADNKLQGSSNPALIMTAGIMHFCSGDRQGAAVLFERAVSIDTQNGMARFMLFLIDWMHGRSRLNPDRQEFLELDWRSPFEFYGHLVRVLEGMADERAALEERASPRTVSWLSFVVGMRRLAHSQLAEAEILLENAARLADQDQWVFHLSQSELQRVREQRLTQMRNPVDRQTYQADIDVYERELQEALERVREKHRQMTALSERLTDPNVTPVDRRHLLAQMHLIDPDDSDILAGLIWVDIMTAAWQKALEGIREFLRAPGRESHVRLSIGLMEPIVLHITDKRGESEASLNLFIDRTMDPWYRSIALSLLGTAATGSLVDQAESEPVHILTAHTALGLWAEGSDDLESAIAHYREALSSYMDEFAEYELSLERIKQLRNR
jgi:S1-C subfamily serine protease